MEIEIEHADGVTVCQPVGDLDAYTVPAFRERLTEAATKGNASTLVRLLQTTGFDKIVSVVGSVDEARLSLKSGEQG